MYIKALLTYKIIQNMLILELYCLLQAAELAEFTAKIALLEEAKKKKEEEATEWQHKVIICSFTSFY